MKLFYFLLRISKGTVVMAVIFGILSGISSAALLALIGTALTQGKGANVGLIWGFAGLCLLMPLTRFVSDYLLCRLGHGAVFNLRMKLSRMILDAPMRRLEDIGSHRLLAALTDDVSAIINALLFIPLLFINVAKVVGCIVYIAWLSPNVLVLVGCFIALGVATYRLPLARGARIQKLAREETDALFNHFHALTAGTKELKINRRRREAFLSSVLHSTAATLRRHNVKSTTYFIAAASWGQILFFIFTGALLFLLPSVKEISPAVMTGAIITVLYMITPLDTIVNTLANLSGAGVALKKVESLGLSLTEESAEDGDPAPVEVEPRWNVLELAGVAHTYHHERENSNFSLGPLNLAFSPGELVFIIGGNGSGKTTLLKLIAGLYQPEAGEVLLDGRPITQAEIENYRQLFSIVFSDFYLFESLLGADAAELDQQALRYLKQLHLDHKVQVKDGRLSTLALSQGQRKRLALLVAYLEDRPIYIFDEWAADQDPQFKEIFYLELLPELKSRGKTVIVISHDDRYYHVADRIIKLEQGQIICDKEAMLLQGVG
jgi:putative pyoverdin transport system ATP-binding/permease protein